MRKMLVIGIITISLVKNAKAQAGVPDTLAYLQSIVVNKAQFVGQSFSVLLDSLKIQVKYFHPICSIHYDKNKETSTHFSFYFPQDGLDDFYLTYPCLAIYWQTPLNNIQSDALWENNNGGEWTTSVVNFYANGIIKDIRIRE